MSLVNVSLALLLFFLSSTMAIDDIAPPRKLLSPKLSATIRGDSNKWIPGMPPQQLTPAPSGWIPGIPPVQVPPSYGGSAPKSAMSPSKSKGKDLPTSSPPPAAAGTPKSSSPVRPAEPELAPPPSAAATPGAGYMLAVVFVIASSFWPLATIF